MYFLLRSEILDFMKKQRAVEGLSRILTEAGVVVEPLGEDAIAVGPAAAAERFRVVWVGQGYPQDVRRALTRDQPTEGMTYLAERMSSGAVALLREHDANWADRRGNVDMARGGVVIRLGETSSAAADEIDTPMWTLSAGAVAEVLLNQSIGAAPDERQPILRIHELADTTGRSPAQISKVLQRFDAASFTVKDGSARGIAARRHIADAPRLLSEWASWYCQRPLPGVRISTAIRGQEAIIRAVVDEFGPSEVLVSGGAALNAYTPFLTADTPVQAYVAVDDVSEIRRRVVRSETLREVERGERLTLNVAEGQISSTARTLHGMEVVSPIRLYGDLLRRGGRLEEAADELRERAIGY